MIDKTESSRAVLTAEMKIQQEKVLGVLYTLLGVFGVLAGCWIYSQDPDACTRLTVGGYRWVFFFFIAGFIVFCIDIVFGISIALRRPWTRRLPGYAVSIVNLVTLFPVGTLLGIWSLCWQNRKPNGINVS